ncbi:MAG: phosphoribosylformylglycinamidine synthase subunit PurL [Flavobacteriales bacterium]|nr:phosphoribosylformylglycinamidine synthase subunit PurL [Flavobacteriales bacterium]
MEATVEDSKANLKTAESLGLLPEEFEQIKKILGRSPNFTELSIFSVMWSEHCCYKNSIKLLKTLPREGSRMLVEAGEENAGLVDIGDDLACCFKIESHNHPSAIEPYQGAATGVGGINRDIFTMGARPVAQLNSLRFGNIERDRTKWHVKGVVKGIGDYGNAFGIPVLGGEVFFDDCYNTNPLVNAMSVGIMPKGATISAISEGPGNPVFIVGSSTGKDGIHGATFASGDITAESANDLPSVQVGDPFQEKLLLEATQDLMKVSGLVGMQDMGAAGITCSTLEMSDKGGCGMKVYLDKVPTRQANMKPFEILLSESQERMLVVVEKGKEDGIKAVFEKWDLNCVEIGEVTEGGICQYYMHDELVAEVPAYDLVLGGGAPVYDRETKVPDYYEASKNFSIDQVKEPESLRDVAEYLISHPNIASKRWVISQYDSMVGTSTMTTNVPTDAGISNIKGTKKALVMTTDCNSRYVSADPEIGAQIAVTEAARNIVCSGGEPLAITNCLNFGNPYNKEVYWQFDGVIKGMGKACTKFSTPVTGGNVSFYNQTSTDTTEDPVFPTPVIGMLGILDDKADILSLDFKNEGDHIYLLGEVVNDISSSEYVYSFCELKRTPAPYFDLDKEYELQQTIKALNAEKLISSAHDVADGGLFITLLESAMPGNFGFKITSDDSVRKDAFLFGEGQGRVVVSVSSKHNEAFTSLMDQSLTSYQLLGTVDSSDLNIDGDSFGSVQEAKDKFDSALGNLLEVK